MSQSAAVRFLRRANKNSVAHRLVRALSRDPEFEAPRIVEFAADHGYDFTVQELLDAYKRHYADVLPG